MVIKILYYFLCIFFIVIFMLVSQDPYSLDLNLNSGGKPIVEFFGLKNYRLSDKGVDIEIAASKAQRFEGKDVMYDIDALMIDNDAVERIISKNATLADDIIYLEGGVEYIRDTLLVSAEAVEFHQNSGKLIGKTPFTLESNGMRAQGKSFVYDTKNKKFDALDIRANIETRKQ